MSYVRYTFGDVCLYLLRLLRNFIYACCLEIFWRRNVYFLNTWINRVFYHFNRSRALQIPPSYGYWWSGALLPAPPPCPKPVCLSYRSPVQAQRPWRKPRAYHELPFPPPTIGHKYCQNLSIYNRNCACPSQGEKRHPSYDLIINRRRLLHRSQEVVQSGLTYWPYQEEALFEGPYLPRENVEHFLILTKGHPSPFI